MIEHLIILFLVSTSIVATLYIPTIRYGLNIADEGYLLHGTKCLMKGQVPIRDFRAYDPGRYYWCALWMKFLKPGFISQRISMAGLMILALTVSSYLILYSTQSWYITIPYTLVAFVLMDRNFKMFEAIFVFAQIAIVFYFLIDTNPYSYLMLGIFGGISLSIGINLALYSAISSVVSCLIKLLHSKDWSVLVDFPIYAGLGLILGITPLIFLSIRHNGYLKSYWTNKIRPILKRGETNLPLPYPWIWARISVLKNYGKTKRILFKLIFTLLPIVYVLSFLRGTIWMPLENSSSILVISSSLVGLIFLHYLFSRSDTSHLMRAILPLPLLLVGLLQVYLSELWLGVAGIIVFLFFVWLIEPQILALFKKHKTHDYEKAEFNNESLILPKQLFGVLKTIEETVLKYTGQEDKVFFGPALCSLYPLFDRKPAVYDIFCVYPAKKREQKKMLRELKSDRTKLVIINNNPLDGREDLRFSSTHPLVWEYFNKAFLKVEEGQLPGNYNFFVKIRPL